MTAAPTPPNERERLERLHSLSLLDTAPEALFDAVVRIASSVCETPVALISLVDGHRQWFKAELGLPGVTQTPRELAFCAHAILGEQVMEVPDAQQDPRFAGNALVTGAPHIRFYAGAPITLEAGINIGTVCVIDQQRRSLSPVQTQVLRDLACTVAEALRLRQQALQLSEAQRRRVQAQVHSEELERLLQERTDMLDVLAHEVRQPLNNASAALQNAASALEASSVPAASASVLRAQAVMGRVLAGVDNTLAAAVLLSGVETVAKQATPLGLLIALTIADLTQSERSRIRVQPFSDTLQVQVDTNLMRLAIRNLLTNALKFSPSQAPVVITVEKDPDAAFVTIDVADQGNGVEPEVVQRLFERGARGRGPAGQLNHGLGLYIVHRTMALHGGAVNLLRNTPLGTTMRLSLPTQD